MRFELLTSSDFTWISGGVFFTHLPTHFPSVAIGKVLLSEYLSEQVLRVILPSTQASDFVQTVSELIPHLTLIETVRLCSVLTEHNQPYASEVTDLFFKRWNIQDLLTWTQLSTQLLSVSLEVQKYFALKKLHTTDFEFLQYFDDIQWWHPYFEHFCRFQFSKSEWLIACEQLCVISKRNFSDEGLLQIQKPFEFLRIAKTRAQPRTQSVDALMSERLKQQPWYHQNKMKWIRAGDRSGIEVKALIQSPIEAKRFRNTCEQMTDDLVKDSSFWNP